MNLTAEPYLNWVGQELATTLSESRSVLEQYAENPDQRELLQRCGDLLHSGHGALHMVEVYGAALLAEEMVHVARGLYDGEISDGDGAMDALSNAMVQLPAYLDRVLNGGRDIPLVLLPLLNDLRAVRGTVQLSESNLFVLKLSGQQPANEASLPAEPSGEDVQFVARRLRPRYQAGLLGYLRGEQVDSNLATMAVVVRALEEASTQTSSFQTWWVTGAVIEALRDEGLESGASIKRLVGQIDREIKRLIAAGEAEFAAGMPADLLDNLLYFVARATSSGQRVSAVKTSFSLSGMLPENDEAPADETFSLSAPSVTLMRTVAAAIKQDLGQVKDVLDIHVRTRGGDPAPLGTQPDVLRKIANTLAMLGLDGLRDQTNEQIAALTAVNAGSHEDGDALLRVAEALLTIEDRLDAQLLDALSPGSRDGEGDAETDFREVAGAVLRECMVNLARVKDAISTHIAHPEQAHALDAIPTLLNGINAGLLMLDKGRAVEVLGRIGACLRGEADKPLTAMRMDHLADAIVSVEYYMETLQNGRRDPWYMLDNADRCLDGLGVPQSHAQASSRPDASMPVGQFEPADQAERVESTEPVGQRPESAPAEAGAISQADGGTARLAVIDTGRTRDDIAALSAQTIAGSDADEPMPPVDPELLELFIEEARDEISSLAEAAPKWTEAPEQRDALLKLRRSFHTLKGSGRMVGAHRIGDYAWSFEKLLNKVIDGTQPASAGVVVLINAAVGMLPELVEQLENGVVPTADVDGLMAQAERLARAPAMPSADTSDSETGEIGDDRADATTPTDTARPAASGMDPVLYDIFSTESQEHLATVYEWIGACQHSSAPYPVTRQLHRAWHTLSGTANTAAVGAAAAIARPLDRYISKHFESDFDLPADAIELIGDAADAIRTIVKQIGSVDGEAETHPDLIERVEEMEARFEALVNDQQLAASADAAMPGGDATLDESDTAPADSATAQSAADSAFDAEIAAIFSDEATELLDATDSGLQHLGREPDSPHVIAELQRHLHTLKGGARMAGIAAMGNLSHELETLVRDIGEGRQPANSSTISLLQASVDRLHGMRDALAAGLPVVEADDVLMRIGKLTGRAIPAVAADTVDEPATPPLEDAVMPVTQAVSEADAKQQEVDAAGRQQDGEPAATADEIDTQDRDRAPQMAEVAQDATHALADEVADEVARTDAADLVETPTEYPEQIEPSGGDDWASDRDSDIAQVGQNVFEQPVLAQPPVAASGSARVARAVPAEASDERAADRQDVARVSATLLDDLLNNAGEISIYHSRMEQQLSSISFNLSELTQTVARLRGQLRNMEIETEAQMLFRHQEETAAREEFDPLELDRYSTVQQLSRALAESVSDLTSIQELLSDLAHDAGTLLVQQARVTTEMQDGLMRTRMVPFQRHVSRLQRLVRQTASEAGKHAELRVEGASGELDRQVLERMLPPLEHMLRNSIVHGIETPDERRRKGKTQVGEILIRLQREGSQMVLELADDGAGFDVAAISRRARARGMLNAGDELTETDVLQFIVEPGFSTARELTQAAGRGVGMDVVANEVKQLGGTLEIGAASGHGARLVIRLPQTLAITQALLVRTGEDIYAIPLPSVEGIVRVPRTELQDHLGSDDPAFDYGGQRYRFQHVGVLLGGHPANVAEAGSAVPVILVRAGEHSTALIADEMLGSREIVVKPVGPQIAAIRGIAGATILGDGSIVVILDVSALVRTALRGPVHTSPAQPRVDDRRLVMVVDDSITVRRVTQRLLERNDIRVITAKDGVDAVSLLQEHEPDLMLLDIEMPRMDGYEVATHVRNSPRLQHIPIVMVTSRVGEKHRARAFELGVDAYLGKPYQEAQLLETLEPLLTRRTI